VNTEMNFRDSYSVDNLLLVEDLLACKEVLCLMELVCLFNESACSSQLCSMILQH